jgi:hypothetical protein
MMMKDCVVPVAICFSSRWGNREDLPSARAEAQD